MELPLSNFIFLWLHCQKFVSLREKKCSRLLVSPDHRFFSSCGAVAILMLILNISYMTSLKTAFHTILKQSFHISIFHSISWFSENSEQSWKYSKFEQDFLKFATVRWTKTKHSRTINWDYVVYSINHVTKIYPVAH